MQASEEVAAMAAVRSAEEDLAAALGRLRDVRGESALEPCSSCDGSGKDMYCAESEGVPRDCSRCKGSGKRNKLFPMIVKRVAWVQGDVLIGNRSTPERLDWVAVRPVGEEHGGKTFLGIALGDIALSTSARLVEGVLEVSKAMYNPAMFIPELGVVVYGAGSWWRRIRTADDLKTIDDTDIEAVWYVRALQQLRDPSFILPAKAPAQ